MGLFSKTISVSTDAAKIRELLTRGVERVFPNTDFAEKRLLSGERLTVYFGIDPTGPILHLGHAVNLLKLRQFQDLGHSVIILYGGFTTQIGDPSGKLSERQQLSSRQVKKNTIAYKKSIGKILDIKKAAVRFVDNEKWSNKLKPKDILDLAARFTVSQLLERDMFQERIKQGKEIYAHEFLYPIFQAYDAVTMGVDIQIGGNDQTFNMLAGRTLMRKIKNKEKAVIAMKLLADPAGKKMGKTEGNMIPLEDTPSNMFGKVMSWPDRMIFSGFELCTRVPLGEIEEMKKQNDAGENPRDIKARLAREIVSLYHGEKEAEKAEKEFNQTFREKTPADFTDIELRGRDVADALLEKGLISSKSELRRLIQEGGVTKLSNGEKANISFFEKSPAGEYRLGKHRFVRIH